MAGSADIAWPGALSPVVRELVSHPPPAVRPVNQLQWEMLSWGLVTLSVLGLRHHECEGLSISDLKAPVGGVWQLKILSAIGRTKTGLPGKFV
jgi:hypothetical protein